MTTYRFDYTTTGFSGWTRKSSKKMAGHSALHAADKLRVAVQKKWAEAVKVHIDEFYLENGGRCERGNPDLLPALNRLEFGLKLLDV